MPHRFLITTVNEELTEGVRLAESFNDGPAFWNSMVCAVKLVDDAHGASGLVDVKNCIIAAGGFPTLGTIEEPVALRNDLGSPILQDTRDWFAVHNGKVNLAMADGSVKTIVDLNGDGFLNPGFDVNDCNRATTYEELASRVGYTDSTLEMHPSSVFCCVMLNNEEVLKDAFED